MQRQEELVPLRLLDLVDPKPAELSVELPDERAEEDRV
jgi:hypothetical protein